MSQAASQGDANPTDHLLAVIYVRFARTGEWPVVDQLRHELDRADDELDVLAVGRDLDPTLGTVGLSHGDRARLTIHGVARCPGSGEVLEDLLNTMKLAYQRFRADGIDAHVGSDDLVAQLSLSPLRIRCVYELMLSLPGVGGGTGSSSEAWQRDITADVVAFKRAETIEHLLQAAPRRRGPARDALKTAAGPGKQAVTLDLPTAAAPLAGFHAGVVGAAAALFADGHYAQAAFQAFKALDVELRARSGLDLSGRELAEKALGGASPRLRLSRHRGRTGADEQEGLRFLCMGVMQGLRNPGGHELDALDRQEAVEEIGVASLLMRWLDTGRVIRVRAKSRPSARRAPEAPRNSAQRTALQPRLIVLRELLDMSHRQARTSEILELDTAGLAREAGVAEDHLQDALVDLLAEGLVEPNAPTMGRSAEQGACRITGDGVRELGRLGSDGSGLG